MTYHEISRLRNKVVGKCIYTNGRYGYRATVVVAAKVIGFKGNRVLLQFSTSSGSIIERLTMFRDVVPANKITHQPDINIDDDDEET